MKKQLLTIIAITLSTVAAFAQGYNIKEYDIRDGSASSRPNSLHAYNNTVYCYATDSAHGEEIWYIDTNDAPKLLADLDPRAFVFPSPIASGYMAVLDGKLYFVANDSTHGIELWSYDGKNPPSLVSDLYPGTPSSRPTYLTVLNGKLYFAATTPATAAKGNEIFEYNPAKNKVTQKTTLGANTVFSNIGAISTYKDWLVFSCNNNHLGNELFAFDPTTNLSWNLANIAKDDISANPIGFTTANGVLFFIARHDSIGRQVYKYDVVQSPTRVTKFDALGLIPVSQDRTIMGFNDKLYMSSRLSNGAYGLYNYDTKTDSAERVDTDSKVFYSRLTSMLVHNNMLYFVTASSNGASNVWEYDGQNIPKQITFFSNTSTFIGELTSVGNDIYFSATDTNGRELYKISPWATSVERAFTNLNHKVYPNPTNDITHILFQLSKARVIQIVLTDMQGRTVYQSSQKRYEATVQTVAIPTNNIPAGNYIYSLRGSDGTPLSIGKLVKE